MAEIQSSKTGYCEQTKIYYSLHTAVPIPPLSVFSYSVSLLHSSAALSTTTFLIDADSGHRVTYSTFLQQVDSLSSFLKSLHPSLSKNDVAFVLCPPSLHVPVLYFSLLSLGVVVSPSNPLASPSELTHQIQLSKPVIAFSTSAFANRLPPNLPAILLDSPKFLSALDSRVFRNSNSAAVNQSDAAAILYSSGTTGRAKGVVITHRNLIAVLTGFYVSKDIEKARKEGNYEFVHPVSLFTLPLFHIFGFYMLLRAAALGESVVVMGKFDSVKLMEAVERYRVTFIPVAPPIITAMIKSDLVDKYDLSSLQILRSGGAPLGKEVGDRFRAKFPHVEIIEGYGLTETAGAVTRTNTEDAKRYGSVGNLAQNLEAKIIDPESGDPLPPGKRGELWLRGPAIMKGYAGDDAATAESLDSEGWLKTGDLCYFDSDGFLYIVDRLKELIKYKGYQVPPAELESLLLSMPEIADAAVIPYPDEEAGQIPMAYVVRKLGSTIFATQIMDFIAKQVAPYKKIRRVAFINEIPKSPAGKILRRELVNHALCSKL